MRPLTKEILERLQRLTPEEIEAPQVKNAFMTMLAGPLFGSVMDALPFDKREFGLLMIFHGAAALIASEPGCKELLQTLFNDATARSN